MEKLLFVLLCVAIFSGRLVDALSYDYSASLECLAEPLKPQYGGGIIRNPEFNNGIRGWFSFDFANIALRTSPTGNSFLVAYSRDQPYQSLSQKIYLHKDKLYTFSAWVQVNEGGASVTAVFKTAPDQFIHAGTVEAKSGCWSLLKGGFSVETTGLAEFYFESKNTTIEIWVDSVSLQPFTKDQWRAHQTQSIDQVRKQKMRFQAVDANGNTLHNATVSIQQTRPGFPMGIAIAQTILTNPSYQSWLTSRSFTVTTFENEMKWYSTETSQGREDYATADAMLAFSKQHGISVRGHNILWDDPKYQMGWVNSLTKEQLQYATNKRTNSIASRYKGQVISWDVVNENLHFNYFEDRLGGDASINFFKQTHQIDPEPVLFLNDYNTLEEPSDGASTPGKYLHKLRQLRHSRALLGIGLESHFNQTNIPYMRAALDILAGAKVPIWLTEVDVYSGPNQAQYLEEILREGFSHPAVQGIVIWAAWHPWGCDRMCLTDNNFRNLPTGDVVDKLLSEWKSGSAVGVTDKNGFFEVELFHGDYEITVSHPSRNSPLVQSLKLDVRSQKESSLIVA